MSRLSVLTVGYVKYPLFIELLCIKCVHYRAAGNLSVACISHTLNMGTVAGDSSVHIAELGMYECIVGPIEHLIVTIKA